MRIATSLTTEDASMGTEAPTIVTIPVRCAPKKAPCPKCGQPGRRKRILPPRRVRTVAYNAVAYLEIANRQRIVELFRTTHRRALGSRWRRRRVEMGGGTNAPDRGYVPDRVTWRV
jgi:hypothetical protein